MHILSKRIRLCRRLLGMTQEELAGQEFTKNFISQVERGRAMPSIEALIILAEKLHQRPGSFLEGDAEPDYEAIIEAMREFVN